MSVSKEDLDRYFEIVGEIEEKITLVIEKILEHCNYKGKRNQWTWYE